MFDKLFEKINEMQDESIITITKVVDDDTGIWADDEFEFRKHALYDKYINDKEAAKRLANELRKVADMVERESNES